MAHIKLSQLEMLVSVADAGGFSAASFELNCSQSRISHAIAELESRLHTQLLVRSRHGCRPTETGQRVIDKARRILRMTENIVDDFHSEENEAGAGHVRIASIPSITAQLVPHLVETLVEEFPGIRIEIFDGCREHSEIARMVRAGEADLGITQPHGDEDLLVFPFVYDTLIAVVPPTAAVSSPLCWTDLRGLPLILQSRSNGQWILDQLRQRGIRQLPAYCMEHESTILTMVERGLGYTVLPRLAVPLKQFTLKVVELPQPIERKLAIVTRANASGSAVETVGRLLRDGRVVMRSDAFRMGVVCIDS